LYLESSLNFIGERVDTRGYIDLFRTFSTIEAHYTVMVWYPIIEAGISYNKLIKHKNLNALGVVVSTAHMAIQFPTED